MQMSHPARIRRSFNASTTSTSTGCCECITFSVRPGHWLILMWMKLIMFSSWVNHVGVAKKSVKVTFESEEAVLEMGARPNQARLNVPCAAHTAQAAPTSYRHACFNDLGRVSAVYDSLALIGFRVGHASREEVPHIQMLKKTKSLLTTTTTTEVKYRFRMNNVK